MCGKFKNRVEVIKFLYQEKRIKSQVLSYVNTSIKLYKSVLKCHIMFAETADGLESENISSTVICTHLLSSSQDSHSIFFRTRGS